MWSSLQIYTVEVQGKCSKVTVNCNSDAHGAVTECKKCIGTVNTVNSCIFGIINICSVVCTWMLSVALLSRYLRFGTTRDKWITIFCRGISYFPAASNWILAKKGLRAQGSYFFFVVSKVLIDLDYSHNATNGFQILAEHFKWYSFQLKYCLCKYVFT